ncbi:hypothetical protein C3747_795g4 [Trypanosoma cruzi]|uniref:Uncharacterized protein n=1 Tax=Trypanosoma cruzi TaxID=5693 RepID=A0A2V2UJ93_TRYCR|nr:hypothetical protein C3747_795g4 [Trypanosoma cruzi]
MEVPRAKVVSLNDLTVQVYNFHCRKADPGEEKLLKKLKFLRMLQIKVGNYFTFSSLVKRRESHSNPLQQESDIADETSGLLYDAMDVYTNSRAVIQIHLLRGRILRLKMAFNLRFDNLCERKKRNCSELKKEMVVVGASCGNSVKRPYLRISVSHPFLMSRRTPRLFLRSLIRKLIPNCSSFPKRMKVMHLLYPRRMKRH